LTCESAYPATRAQPGAASVPRGALKERTIAFQLKLVRSSAHAQRSPGYATSEEASCGQLNSVISGALANAVSQSCSA